MTLSGNFFNALETFALMIHNVATSNSKPEKKLKKRDKIGFNYFPNHDLVWHDNNGMLRLVSRNRPMKYARY